MQYIQLVFFVAAASLNGHTRPRNDAVMLAANTSEPIYSEYTEIQAYSVCREAMERCNRPEPNPNYVPMERKSNSLICRAVPETPGNEVTPGCTINAYQNNEYMTTDEEGTGHGYAASANPLREIQPTTNETRDTYLDLSERIASSSTEYAAVSSKDKEELLTEEEHSMETEEKMEQNEYLLPLPD